MSLVQLYKAFPVKDYGLVPWVEVQRAYEKFEYLFSFELLEDVMKRDGFTLSEWTALQSGDEERVRQAFNWYANVLIAGPPKKKQEKKTMSQSNAAEAAPVSTTGENLNIRVIERIEKFGSGLWELLHKESSKADGWAETTKAMEIPGMGVIVKVTCSCREEGSIRALTNTTSFIAGAQIGRQLDQKGVVVGRQLKPGGPELEQFFAAVPLSGPAQTEKLKVKKLGRKTGRPAKELQVEKLKKEPKAEKLKKELKTTKTSKFFKLGKAAKATKATKAIRATKTVKPAVLTATGKRRGRPPGSKNKPKAGPGRPKKSP